MYNGQAEQDKFVLSVLKDKTNGFFLEIGSNHPIEINNSYVLENTYGWNGIMVEYDDKYLNDYKKHRPNSIHVIKNAYKVDYKNLLLTNNVPSIIDYLQIDLDEKNGSTIKVLNKLDTDIMDEYKFSIVTFEHDIYSSNKHDTRLQSRKIFDKRGYLRVFSDVNDEGCPYEDWYVHPDLVDIEYVKTLIKNNEINYRKEFTPWKVFKESLVERSINWKDIVYH